MLLFMAMNGLIGVGAGLLLTAAIFYFDVGGILTHAQHSRSLIISIFLLAFPLSLMLGGAAIGTAIMTMPYERKYRD